MATLQQWRFVQVSAPGIRAVAGLRGTVGGLS